MEGSVDISLRWARTGDAVENVLDISPVFAETFVIALRAGAGGDFARHQAWGRARYEMRSLGRAKL